MNYEAYTRLSDEKFKRLIDVERIVFDEMLTCLEQAQATLHQKGGLKTQNWYAQSVNGNFTVF